MGKSLCEYATKIGIYIFTVLEKILIIFIESNMNILQIFTSYMIQQVPPLL